MTTPIKKRSVSAQRLVVLIAVLAAVGVYRYHQIEQIIPRDRLAQNFIPSTSSDGRFLSTAKVVQGESRQGPFLITEKAASNFAAAETPSNNAITMAVSIDKEPGRYQDLWPVGMSIGGTDVNRLVNKHFRVTAQALTNDEKAIGSPSDVVLTKDSDYPPTIKMRIPAVYSTDTKKLRIILAENDVPHRTAQWVLGRLSHSIQNFDDAQTPLTHFHAGDISIDAEAAERPDIDRRQDPLTQIKTEAPGELSKVEYPDFDDSHVITGLPAITCAVRIKQETKPGVDPWKVDLLRMTPQWSAAGDAASNNTAAPLITTLDPAYEDAEPFFHFCGSGFPGQQKFVKIEAAVRRLCYRQETLKFQNASVQADPRAHNYSIYWRQFQSLTTPSGITVIALNPRIRLGDAAATTKASQTSLGAANLYLAWKMPDNYATIGRATPDLHNRVEWPQALPPLTNNPAAYLPPPNWGEVSYPGGTPQGPRPSGIDPALAALRTQGYTLMHIIIQQAPTPSGASEFAPLEELGLRMNIIGEIQRFPATLTVPVRGHFSPGMTPKPIIRREWFTPLPDKGVSGARAPFDSSGKISGKGARSAQNPRSDRIRRPSLIASRVFSDSCNYDPDNSHIAFLATKNYNS